MAAPWANSKFPAVGVAASYYNAPETADRWTGDGWFRTGDIATIDPHGCIRLMDRSMDLVKSGGE
jgi:fatty-acyl-CoA synthase